MEGEGEFSENEREKSDKNLINGIECELKGF